VAGPRTIEIMQSCGATALAIDAGRTLLLDRDQMLEKANQAAIAVAGYDPES
jgi:UDP-2,3-diacylglucosamine hydrolase